VSARADDSGDGVEVDGTEGTDSSDATESDSSDGQDASVSASTSTEKHSGSARATAHSGRD
jgi:hypothetical protein